MRQEHACLESCLVVLLMNSTRSPNTHAKYKYSKDERGSLVNYLCQMIPNDLKLSSELEPTVFCIKNAMPVVFWAN